MRYAVFGVGRQGLAAIYDLVRNCGASDVHAVDYRFADAEARRAAEVQLRDLLGERGGCVQFGGLDLGDAANAGEIGKQLEGCDCLLSALPYALNGEVAKLAIRAGVPMCDMGGNPEMVEFQQSLAQQHDHVIVPDCGLAPGIGNLFIKHLHDHHGARDVRAYCGGLPDDIPDPAANPLQYKLVFSAEGLISEYMGRCALLTDGRIDYRPALGGYQHFDERHEAFFTSNNSPHILEFFASLGIRSCEYRTLRYHGHLEKIRMLQAVGFLQRDDNTDPDLAARLRAAEALRFDRRTDRDRVLLVVTGLADDGSTTTIQLTDRFDADTGFTAMERTTSWGTTIVAQALAEELYRPRNFATPEQFIDTRWFVDQLRLRTESLTIRTAGAT